MYSKSLFFLLSILVLFSGCSVESLKNVKELDKKLLSSKLGTIENQKLITKIEKKQPPKIVKKRVEKVKKRLNKSDYIPVSLKKQNFNKTLIPIVTKVYNNLYAQYTNIKNDIESNRNQEGIEQLYKKYKVTNDEDLLSALKPHPISIVLAQGAIESAWLTSRFTKVANNIFGVWSFNVNEPRVEAASSRGEKKIYLKKYENFQAAIEDYYKNIGRNSTYKEFRAQKMINSDPFYLSDFLLGYSEKREVYTELLKKVILKNNFDQYDIKED